MERAELESMSIDELWALHEAVSSLLAEKLAAEKRIVVQRLAELKPIMRASVQRRRHRLPPTERQR
jgi:DNA-binding protein H-NS